MSAKTEATHDVAAARPGDICIVGMAGRFPGADTVDALWDILRAGRVTTSRFTDSELSASGVGAAERTSPAYVPVRGTIGGVEDFDTHFFGITAADADGIDPQQRVLLECASEVLENAGCNADTCGAGIGVFVGGAISTYLLANLLPRRDVHERFGLAAMFHGNVTDSMAARIAYKLNLRGPAITVQTACSSSLVAVHVAAQSLLNHECDGAIAGGVAIRVPQASGYTHRAGGIEAADGECRPFDAAATGTVFSNGAGLVLLKRYEDAVAEGDCVRAVILGSAVNNDGSDKVGFAAPSVSGQVRVMEEALGAAGIAADSVDYLQAHATGTAIGDPIEALAISSVYGSGRRADAPLILGAVKGNLGHLDVAAGITGLITAVLAIENKEIPPVPNFSTLHPEISWTSEFIVPTTPTKWITSRERRAAVSAFGVGGTNAHLLIEEAPHDASVAEGRAGSETVVLSAKTPSALDAMTGELAALLRSEAPPLDRVARTLQDGRRSFSFRRAVVGSDAREVGEALAGPDARRVITGVARPHPTIVFMCPGQGTVRAGVAAELYRSNSAFRAALDECSEVLAPDLAPLNLLLGALDTPLPVDAPVVQPATFAFDYAVAQALIARGVVPTLLCGHSLGEYVAACLAGMWSLSDALRLAAVRGRIMADMRPGAMLAVAAPEEAVRSRMPPTLDIASVNGPANTVVSGRVDDVEAFRRTLDGNRTASQVLPTSLAFHSRAVEPVVEELREALVTMPCRRGHTPLVSGVTGEVVPAGEALTVDYWLRHLREPVNFRAVVDSVVAAGDAVVFEAGAGEALSGFVRSASGADDVFLAPPLVRPTCADALPHALAAAWTRGVPVRWERDESLPVARQIQLPTYPFERTRHWVEPRADWVRPETLGVPQVEEEALRVVRVSWEQAPVQDDDSLLDAERANWLVFGDDAGFADAAVRLLSSRGQIVTVVERGDRFFRKGRGRFEVRPDVSEDYVDLLRALRSLVRTPSRVLHCWSVDEADADGTDNATTAFLSIFHLAKALLSERLMHNIRMAVVTAGAFDITGEEALKPEATMVLGPILILPKEIANLKATLVDVAAPTSLADATTVAKVVSEVLAQHHPVVAWRGRHRWVRSCRPESVNGQPWAPREDRVCVITGGLGGLGLATAERLLNQGARVALVSRHPPPPTSSLPEALRSWADVGSADQRLLLIHADVTDAMQLGAALDGVRQRWTRLDLVVHAAGVPGGGAIERRSFDAIEAVLAPKVAGTRNLLAATERDDATIILFSSAASIEGSYGQADYAAANAFMDAAAIAACRDGRKVVSVSWQTWQDVGMAVTAEIPAGLAAVRDAMLEGGLPSTMALRALDLIEQTPGGHVAVYRRDPSANPRRPLTEMDLRALPGSGAGRPRPELLTDYEAPAQDLQRRLVQIWEEYFGIAPIGIRDEFLDLGGHSLLAAQIVARVRDEFALDVPISLLFELQSIAQIAVEIERLILDEVETAS